MGLKRRGTGRRQVLNLDDMQDAPRKTWQSKYLQICVDHNKKRQVEIEEKTSQVASSSTTTNPLSGLVGHYRSDSDSEDEAVAQKQELNDQVSVFLKEIQTIAPASSGGPPVAEPAPASVLTPTLPLVPPPAAMPAPAYAASDLAALPPEGAHSVTGSEYRAGCYPWQVCYDADTGYPYYWNMETNEVTWEAPENVRTYLNHYWMQQMTAGTYPMHHNYLPEQNVYNQNDCSEVVPGNNVVETVTPKDYFPKKCKPHYEESEYEKIEMITSYGPESDESEDEKIVKKPKIEDNDSSEYTAHMIGPLPADGINCNYRSNKKPKQLSPSDHRYSDSLVSCISALQQEEEQYEGPVFEGSSLLSNDVPDMGPPGEEGSDISYPPEPRHSNKCDITCEKKTAKEVEKAHITDGADYNEKKKTAKDSTCSNTIEGDDMDQDENVILTRICNQARILKELGGEIPDEVQHLIEPFQNENQEKEINTSDDVIDTKHIADDEASSSATTNSFALIAGYGNDSDGEDDKKGGNGRQHLNKYINSDPIFPILNYKNQSTVEKKAIVEENALKVLTSSEPTVEPKQMKRRKRLDIPNVSAIVKAQGIVSNSDSTSGININASIANSGSNSVVTSSKFTNVSESALSEQSRTEKHEVDVSGDISSGSKSISNRTSVADSAASAPYIRSYNSDITYGGRRGFGFPQSQVNGSDPTQDTFDTRFVKDSEDKTFASSKMINFIKADTLNPTADSEIKSINSGDDEMLKVNDECDKTQEHLNEMSELINEKVTFLNEGKEPVSSLQLLTTQYKTLAEAWEMGALCESYWNQWLEHTLGELSRLEEAAAPAGWSCEWCRIYKRYFYRNLENGKMQWEYPKGDDIVDLCKQAPPPPPPTPPPPPPPPPPASCSSPTPLPPVQQSSTSPQQISGCDKDLKQSPVKKKKVEGTKCVSSHVGEIEESDNSELLISKVQESSPSINSQTDPAPCQLGESLPSNVDSPETVNVVVKLQEQDLSDIDGVEMGTEDEFSETPENVMEPRKQNILSPAVIAKPPAKTSLHDELDSFYSDLANLEKAGVIPTATEEFLPEQDNIQQSTEHKETIVNDKEVDSENGSKSSENLIEGRKKKKTKLAPGLSLKKKGVSSLVAKWQQVQQEVRRDYKKIDSKESGSQS